MTRRSGYFTVIALALIVLIYAQTGKSENIVPDTHLTTPQIIARHGYPSESHTIVTQDGYLLTIHRIPYSKKPTNITRRQPVYVQHGLLSSSADWVVTGEEKSLAFLLSNLGYDVWLGNIRGNTYSRAHVNYTVDDAEFWDFSWDDMAEYDLPATIDHIANVTGQCGSILYVGHSMGTSMFFALMSVRPEYNKKIRAMFALAPVASMTSVKSPIRLLAPWANDIEWLARVVGLNEFLPHNKILKWLSKYGCELTTKESDICEDTVFLLTGFDKVQFNMTLLPVILGHTPAGTSTRTVIHYAQEIAAGGKFQRYDFGADGNKKRYGTKTPPQYDVSKITVPISLHYADNDWLASIKDVTILYNKLTKRIGKFEIAFKDFNHVDFLWANDAPSLVYDKLFSLMRKYTY